MLLRYIFLCGFFLGGAMACQTTESKKPSEKAYHMDEVWFKGEVDSAFAQATKEDKLVFLYWGAVWCPPCNELKDQVFSKPEFKEMMEPFVPVYLDGDTERAQIWADQLQAYGYPTVLILDGQKQEKLRLSGTINIHEFGDAIRYAHTSRLSLEDLIDSLNKNTLSPDDWQALSYISWEQLPQDRYSKKRIWQLQKDLIEKIPSSYTKVRAILAANYLTFTISLQEEEGIKDLLPLLRQSRNELLGFIFQDHDSIIAARQFINYRSSDTLKLLFPDQKKGYEKWKQTWLKSAETIANTPKLSVDTRLWAVYPGLDIFFMEKDKNQKVPEDLKDKVIASVELANERADSKYERHAVVSGAAYLLRQVKAYENAQSLLEEELETTDTPWYYHSSLSSLARERDDHEKALYWSEKARKSAKGKATRLQWIANDLLLNMKLNSKGQTAHILPLIQEFYDLAFSLPDGFSGRNLLRVQNLAKSIRPLLAEDRIKKTLEEYGKVCADSKKVDQNCKKHFEDLL